MSNPSSLDQTFGALSDPTRRAILDRLKRENTVTVLELAEPFNLSLNAVSKHIKKLEAAGLISREVVGREHRCSLNASPLLTATTWMDTYREFWEHALDGLVDFTTGEQKT